MTQSHASPDTSSHGISTCISEPRRRLGEGPDICMWIPSTLTTSLNFRHFSQPTSRARAF